MQAFRIANNGATGATAYRVTLYFRLTVAAQGFPHFVGIGVVKG